MEISRWRKPPVRDAAYHQPRQGRRNGVSDFRSPYWGLRLLLGSEPVVGTTG